MTDLILIAGIAILFGLCGLAFTIFWAGLQAGRRRDD